MERPVLWFVLLAVACANAEVSENPAAKGITRADLSNLLPPVKNPSATTGEGCPRRFPPVSNADVTAMSFKLRPVPGEDPERVKPGDGVVYRCRRNRDVQVLVLCTPDGSWLTTGVCPNTPSNSSAPPAIKPVPRASTLQQADPLSSYLNAPGGYGSIPILPPQTLKGFAQQNGNCEGGFMTDGTGKALSCPWCTLNSCIDYCLKFQGCIAVSYSNERLIENSQYLRVRSTNRRIGNVTMSDVPVIDEVKDKKLLAAKIAPKPGKKGLKGWVYFPGDSSSCEDETESYNNAKQKQGQENQENQGQDRPPNPPYCFLKAKYTCDYKYKPPGDATYTMFTRDPRVVIPSYTCPTVAPPVPPPPPPKPTPPPQQPPISSGIQSGSDNQNIQPTYRFLAEGNCGGGFLMNSMGEPEGCDICSLATCQQLCNDRGSACLSIAYIKDATRAGPFLEEEVPKAANIVLGYEGRSASDEDRSVWWPRPSFVELPPPRHHLPRHRGLVIEIDDSRVPSWEMPLPPPRRRHHHSHSHSRERPPPPPPRSSYPPRACYLKRRSRCDNPIPCDVSNYDFYYKYPQPK